MHEHLKLVFRPKLTTTIWLSFHGLRKFSQAYQNLYHEKYNSCVVNIPIDMLWYIYHFPCFWMPILIFISERSGRLLSIWIEFLISIRSSFDRMLWNIQFGSPRFISKIIVSTFYFTKRAECLCKCRREKYKYCENQYEFLVCLKRARTGKMVCVRTEYVFLNL